jgi:glutathione peroxidase
MKKLLFPFLFAATFSFAQCPESLHDFTVQTIDSVTFPLSSLAGKKVMVVNTASYCAYTPQYSDLQQLYATYGGPTFEIIGFPCNDFGNQEPGNDDQIDSFCVQNYGVTFQMMRKISITAPDTADVYKWLQLQSRNCVANEPVAWNFNKFLIDEAGNWVAHYSSPVSPLNQNIINWIISPNTTGIESASSDRTISIFPNPASDVLSIQTSLNTEPAALSVFNLLGERELSCPSSGILNRMDISKLYAGVYILEVLSAQGIMRQKFSKN